ncbi:MAG: M1 family metallopeptidase [Saprospiraceae bacterium]
MNFLKIIFFFHLILNSVYAQSYRWQQSVEYDMEIDFDVSKNQFDGIQKLKLINNSPDTLSSLFYHLYYNAFQPGSDMDIRSRQLPDPDPRVGSRISKLSKNEIGFTEIKCAKQNNKKLLYKIQGTILEIELTSPLLPNDSTIIEMEFLSQVPIMIRRSGRNNKEGIEYSMAQWYPKLCNYDEHGWHTPPYVAREFYAPWGDFKVNITIDSKYCLGATGVLTNASEVGCGYSESTSLKNKKTWKFIALNVHDFVWAADPDYKHHILQLKSGCNLHFIYQEQENNKEAWSKLPSIIAKAFEFIETNYGPYPYSDYSFIQGGDGGMEYPMATLITGNRPLNSLVGVSIHELMHSWYQMLLASNESLYPWMDEGFASYAEEEVINYLRQEQMLPGAPEEDPHAETLKNFIKFSTDGNEEALCTHADHFSSNTAYGNASYSKGAICLVQLKYIIGEDAFRKGMLNYYWKWRFRHPNPNDFFRIMEHASNMELDWFKEYFVHSTKQIDYGIDSIFVLNGKTICRLKNNNLFPMPVEIKVTLNNGATKDYYIPLNLMLGKKYFPKQDKVHVLPVWSWVNPFYEFEIQDDISKLNLIQLNPDKQMLDINPTNDFLKFNK